IERDFANQGERVFAILIIENPNIPCDQTTKRIQRQSPYVRFDAAFVQFLHDAVAPFPAKSPARQIIAAADNGNDCGEGRQTNQAQSDAPTPRPFPEPCEWPNLRWLKNSGHARLLKC